MRKEALEIVNAAIKAADPYENTKRLISELFTDERLCVIAVGKAAVPMMRAAEEVLGDRIINGLLVTKYRHTEGYIPKYCTVIEAGHPVSDENSILAAEKGLEIAGELREKDILLVLLSGGGSALFEKSRVPSEIQQDITKRLLGAGASIGEINAVRKRLSLVKGGLLAAKAFPARVITVALSDVLSNDPSVIASGITVRDSADDAFVRSTVRKYLPELEDELQDILYNKDEIKINDGGYYFAGDINILCDAAGKRASELGFSVIHRERDLSGEAREEAVRLIDSVPSSKGRCCYIFGGETVVTISGSGKGGRNQEMALSAAIKLQGKKGIAFISCGSDGTDGPTEDAGGFADGGSFLRMIEKGIDPVRELENNNSNYALNMSGDIVTTGCTGTNVNDITLILTDDYEN